MLVVPLVVVPLVVVLVVDELVEAQQNGASCAVRALVLRHDVALLGAESVQQRHDV
jgi:hypothetical protein